MSDSPLAAHASTPQELRARLDAERAGTPFLVLRDAAGRQLIVALGDGRASVGRARENDLTLGWDDEVSRLHAELERIAGEWTVSDDGLSRNGTFIAGLRIAGRHRLRDGDVLQIGRTLLVFRNPGEAAGTVTRAGAGAPPALTPSQRAVLLALARPLREDPHAGPATNQEIADALVLSVKTVERHLANIYAKLGLHGRVEAATFALRHGIA